MSPNNGGQSSADFESRLAELEREVARLRGDLEDNNENITKSLELLIDVLLEMRRIHCDLPPGCDLVLTLTKTPK